MPQISDARILILATDGFEQSELLEPLEKLREVGAEVVVGSPKSGEIRGWHEKDWGRSVPVDTDLESIDVSSFDALVLPGGQINPDLLRTDERAVALVADFVDSGKVVAAICHAPWMLVEADVLRERRATSYHSIRTDLRNAGATWIDAEVVTDDGIITSRSPKDLPAFIAKIIEEVQEGEHRRRKVA